MPLTPEELTQITEILRAAEERQNAKIDAAEERLNAKIELLNTRIAHLDKRAGPLELRIRSHAAAIRALDTEQESQYDRISKLEGKRPGLNLMAG